MEVKQSTACHVSVYAATFNIATATVTISKNGAAFAAPSDGAITALNYYMFDVSLDATDTNTLGYLLVRIVDGAAVYGFSDPVGIVAHIEKDTYDKVILITGAGATTWTYTVTDATSGLPLDNTEIWITTDSAGNNKVASGYTDAFGVATFYLDAGTYYVWRRKSGYNFSNPDTEVVT